LFLIFLNKDDKKISVSYANVIGNPQIASVDNGIPPTGGELQKVIHYNAKVEN
jgi:hypothetical protein